MTKRKKAQHIVRFVKEQCSSCPQVKSCPVRCRKRFYSLLFSDRQLLLARRRQQLTKEDYQRKCRLRPAIEGTISQFKQRTHNAKVRVRGLRKVRNSLILMAIAINFGRIWAYFLENTLDP
ncbi:transposase, partial [Candidatus Hakubella thermalkaliphila]|uniref:transposase n=1 Tax=Candidatus Hakubella thermalkaliphila TaxID=2754717 RepID=UPI0015930A2F